MKIQIRHRFNGEILHEVEASGLRQAIIDLIRVGKSLAFANLSAADLRDADLRDANLSAADLSAADLSAANLRAADLSAADLSDADLSDADLSDANLRDANLSDADLRDANLSAANLRDANLSAANLRNAKNDLFKILSENKAEVSGLLNAVRAGKIDGKVYRGECACLIGTIAKVKNCPPEEIMSGMDEDRPAEQWFMNLRPGHLPSFSIYAAMTEAWIMEWQRENPS